MTSGQTYVGLCCPLSPPRAGTSPGTCCVMLGLEEDVLPMTTEQGAHLHRVCRLGHPGRASPGVK